MLCWPCGPPPLAGPCGELALAESGVPNTVLRHPIYSEFFLNPGLLAAVEAGELTSNTNGHGMNTATHADLAEAAAVVLTEGDPTASYDFTGALWTYPELATALSDISGRAVRYREVDGDEEFMTVIGPAIRSGAFELQSGDLERGLGRPATSLRDVVAGVWSRRRCVTLSSPRRGARKRRFGRQKSEFRCRRCGAVAPLI